jgi:outer membrane protein TolC
LARLAARSLLAVLALGLAIPAAASAAAADGVTLEDVVRGALRPDNLGTILQDETVKAAAGKLQQAKGQFDWTVSTQDGPQLLIGPSYQLEKGVNVLKRPDATIILYDISASVGRELRNGIQIAPSVTDYLGPSATSTGGLTQIRPGLGLKIPLWRGLGEESADAGERAANDSLIAAKHGRIYALAQAVQTDVQTFWRCLADDQLAQIAQSTEESSAAYQQSLEAMVQRGMMEPTTVQQSAANAVVQHLNVQTAQDTAMVCRRDLGYATTGSLDGPFPSPSGELPAIEPVADGVNRVDVDALTQLALDQRPDLKAAEQSVEAADENVRYAQDQTHPELDLHVDQLSASVSYTQSIQNNAAEGAEAQASAAKSQAEVALRQLQDQIHIDVSDAVRALKRAVSDWTALKTAQTQMERVVSDADKRAKYGSISWADFLAAEQQLAGIQQQMVATRLQFAASLATLRLVTGTIITDGETPKTMAEKFTQLPPA